MKTVPASGSFRPAPIWLLAKARPKLRVEAHDFAGRAHLRAEHRVDAGKAREGQHRFLDRDVVQHGLSSLRSKCFSVSPAMTRAAMAATGKPMALATNGTVRLARGLTSST